MHYYSYTQLLVQIQRLTEFNQLQLFDTVKEMRGMDFLRKKVTIIGGDVTLLGMGISPEDRKLLCEKISIVLHGAATVRLVFLSYYSLLSFTKYQF